MQNYQMTPYHNNQGQEISQRTQSLLASLQDIMSQFQELSHVDVRRILEMAVRFPEQYRATALKSIAEKLVSSMAMHYLDILAVFRQKAEQEDIDAEEQAATITDCMTDLFPMIAGLSHKIAIQTLDDLVTLAAITVGFYGMSHVETAEQAQHWLYALPQEYAGRLAQEHLIATSSLQFTMTAPQC